MSLGPPARQARRARADRAGRGCATIGRTALARSTRSDIGGGSPAPGRPDSGGNPPDSARRPHCSAGASRSAPPRPRSASSGPARTGAREECRAAPARPASWATVTRPDLPRGARRKLPRCLASSTNGPQRPPEGQSIRIRLSPPRAAQGSFPCGIPQPCAASRIIAGRRHALKRPCVLAGMRPAAPLPAPCARP